MTGSPNYAALAPRPPEGDLDLHQLFATSGEIEIDVGFGRGRSLLERARAHPELRLLGIETKVKWAHRVAEECRSSALNHVRVFAADAKALFERLSPPGSVRRIFVHFPDPWWKKKHEKRLLVDDVFAERSARLLGPAGELFVQSDVEMRAMAYHEVLSRHPAFASVRFIDTNPYAGGSNREVRAAQDGLPVWRLLAIRR